MAQLPVIRNVYIRLGTLDLKNSPGVQATTGLHVLGDVIVGGADAQLRQVLAEYAAREAECHALLAGLEIGEALRIARKTAAPGDPWLAAHLNNLGFRLAENGAVGRARTLLEKASRLWRDKLGADHPNCAEGLINLANLDAQQGDLPAARRAADRTAPGQRPEHRRQSRLPCDRRGSLGAGWVDLTAEVDVTYRYAMAAHKAAGIESPLSEGVYITPGAPVQRPLYLPSIRR